MSPPPKLPLLVSISRRCSVCQELQDYILVVLPAFFTTYTRSKNAATSGGKLCKLLQHVCEVEFVDEDHPIQDSTRLCVRDKEGECRPVSIEAYWMGMPTCKFLRN